MRSFTMLHRGLALLVGLALAANSASAAPDPYPELVDPNPAPGNLFGATVVRLPSGDIAVTAPGDDYAAPNAGAVYLFDGNTGALRVTLRGSSANDQIGSGGVVVLPGSNYLLVLSPLWDNGLAVNAGVVTAMLTLIPQTLSINFTNSWWGESGGDGVGSPGSVTVLANGGFVIATPSWDNGAVANAGAVTWSSGAFLSAAGPITPANSLVGSTAGDFVGSGVRALPNGNYVTWSSAWNNGAASQAGAVTWGSGASGVSGPVSSANSLVGSHAFDRIGSDTRVLTTGSVVTCSPEWDNGTVADAGAATFIPAATGRTGVVSSANSLVGSTAGDEVGYSFTPLTNGNYVVFNRRWSRAGAPNCGSVTWANGNSGITGLVSLSNSLAGSSTDDFLGTGNGVVALKNGNYVVISQDWDNGAVADVGAVAWGNGSTGTTGIIQPANSIIGAAAGDRIGFGGVTPLTNGNYVIASIAWAGGPIERLGAVTWASGSGPSSFVVGPSNSLVGSTTFDQVGLNVIALTNGNYVTSTYSWDRGALANAGAVTWGNGATGVSGVVSSTNSLVGASAEDWFGTSLTALSNGHYVASSTFWDDGARVDAGIATWCNGTTGRVGVPSAANSLLGGSSNDRVGTIRALPNGNYVNVATDWDDGAVANVGAVTWCSGATGRAGVVSAANSLVGSSADDRVGGGDIRALPTGHFLVSSPQWNNGVLTDAGALTWANGTLGRTGPVSSVNSLVGAAPSAGIGPSVALADGSYLSLQPAWANGAFSAAGAATWGDGSIGVVGEVTSANSLVGWTAGTGLAFAAQDSANHRFFLRFPNEGGGRVRVGPVAPFAIADTGDLQGDDGGWVAITIQRWALDHAMSSLPVTNYGVWRRVVPTLVSADAPADAKRPSDADVARVRAALPAGVSARVANGTLIVTAGAAPESPAAAFPPGSWILVATVPATQQTTYDVAVPTPVDGVPHDYVVTAHTTTPANWAIVGPVAAQSRNDRAPAKPEGFAAAYANGQTTLQWSPNTESDLSRYELYRGPDDSFVPSPATRIASSPLTSFVDAGPPGRTYKLRAVDAAGNESPDALVNAGNTVDVEPAAPVAFGLDPVHPNPADGGSLRVTFGLPRAGAARLELLDVGGRRVLARDAGALGAGRHALDLARERRIPAGLYWLRLSAGAEQVTRKVVVAR